MKRLSIVPIGIGLLSSCSGWDASAEADAAPGVEADPVVSAIEAPLLAAAAQYREWGVVGPHVLWAPELCISPPPPSAHPSRAEETGDHGGKLFALYASDAALYLRMTGAEPEPTEAPVGTTLAKETYAPVEVPAEDAASSRPAAWTVPEIGFHPYATRDGKTYRTGERRDLFLMLKMPRGTADTDSHGWAYGVVTPQGVLTAAGALETCVRCHSNAPGDHLFGVEFR